MSTSDLLARAEEAKDLLRKRRTELLAEVAQIDAALGLDAPKRHRSPLPYGENTRRTLAFIASHPRSTIAEIVDGVSAPAANVRGVVTQGIYAGKILKSGKRGSYRYRLAQALEVAS